MADDEQVQATQPDGTRRRRHLAWFGGAGVLAVAAIGYVGACYHYKDTIAGGTTVAGRSIGGMTMEQASRQVSGLPGPGAQQQATVTADGQKFAFEPSSAWKPDVARTLDGVTGFSLSPTRLIHHISGDGGAVTPRYTVDEAALARLVKSSAGTSIKGAPTQGKVKFINGEVVVVKGAPGKSVDEKAVAKDVAEHWPGTTAYTTKLVDKQADATQDAVTAFAAGDAKKAMSEPLQVKANGETVTMKPSDVSEVISSDTDAHGKPSIKVDADALLAHVLERSTDMQNDIATDAKVVWKDGKPSVQPGKAGQQIDASKVQSVVAAALTGNHVANLPMKPMQPQVTEKDIDVSSLPTTSMAHFESKLPGGAENAARTHNIETALATLNGMVVRPGEQFSLLRALGYSLTKEKGYVEAGTLQGGIHVDGMGGGVSQVSTVLYNTAFFAGVQLDEHTPHDVYIDRYPMGREATLWNPGVDNTWTNDTGHLILIKAGTSGNKVVMDFYGTRQYDVSTKTGPKTDVVQPKQRTVKDVKGCENSVGNGTPGFQVDVWRTLKKGSNVVRTDKIHTKYQPDDIITCVGSS